MAWWRPHRPAWRARADGAAADGPVLDRTGGSVGRSAVAEGAPGVTDYIGAPAPRVSRKALFGAVSSR